MATPLPIEAILVKACNLAGDYHRRGDVSPWQLLQDSGYLGRRREVDLAAMNRYFSTHPGDVNEWLLYSDNKRVGSGWNFSEANSDGGYVVGYFPSDPKMPQRHFTDAAEACATFVKRELESMAGG